MKIVWNQIQKHLPPYHFLFRPPYLNFTKKMTKLSSSFCQKWTIHAPTRPATSPKQDNHRYQTSPRCWNTAIGPIESNTPRVAILIGKGQFSADRHTRRQTDRLIAKLRSHIARRSNDVFRVERVCFILRNIHINTLWQTSWAKYCALKDRQA